MINLGAERPARLGSRGWKLGADDTSPNHLNCGFIARSSYFCAAQTPLYDGPSHQFAG